MSEEIIGIIMFVCEQGVVDAIGGAAASALQGPIQVTYREAFQSTILPSFERACQNMFQQINESFHKGTQQCKLRCCFTTLIVFLGLLVIQFNLFTTYKIEIHVLLKEAAAG